MRRAGPVWDIDRSRISLLFARVENHNSGKKRPLNLAASRRLAKKLDFWAARPSTDQLEIEHEHH